jgi:hypothetical protein
MMSACFLFDKFELRIFEKLFGSNLTNSFAVLGGKVQTSDDFELLRGSNAIGPVGKNFW